MTRSATLLAFALAAVVGRAVFDRQSPAPYGVLTDAPPTVCLDQQDLSDRVLYVNGMVRIPVCSAGALRLTLTGSSARGKGAHAQVTVGSDVRWESEVLAPNTLSVELDAPAWVTISFLNDRREGAEDRNLWISDLDFD